MRSRPSSRPGATLGGGWPCARSRSRRAAPYPPARRGEASAGSSASSGRTARAHTGTALPWSTCRASHQAANARSPPPHSLTRLEPHALRNDHDSGLRDVEALPVLLQVVADGGAGGDVDVLVDDGLPDPAMAADVHVLEEDGALDAGVAVHAHHGRQDGAVHATAGDDAPLADERVGGAPDAPLVLVREHELGRGVVVLDGEDRPLIVVE